jgi:hypothetical protein
VVHVGLIIGAMIFYVDLFFLGNVLATHLSTTDCMPVPVPAMP